MENLGKLFKLGAAVLGSLGLLATTSENLLGIVDLIQQNFWLILSIAWLLSIVAIWPNQSLK